MKGYKTEGERGSHVCGVRSHPRENSQNMPTCTTRRPPAVHGVAQLRKPIQSESARARHKRSLGAHSDRGTPSWPASRRTSAGTGRPARRASCALTAVRKAPLLRESHFFLRRRATACVLGPGVPRQEEPVARSCAFARGAGAETPTRTKRHASRLRAHSPRLRARSSNLLNRWRCQFLSGCAISAGPSACKACTVLHHRGPLQGRPLSLSRPTAIVIIQPTSIPGHGHCHSRACGHSWIRAVPGLFPPLLLHNPGKSRRPPPAGLWRLSPAASRAREKAELVWLGGIMRWQSVADIT